MKLNETTDPRVAGDDSSWPEDTSPGDEAGAALTPLNEDELRANIEALLYAAEEPLSVKDLAKALPEASRDAIKSSVEELVASYDVPGRGLQIACVAGGYQITTRPEYHERISRLFSSKPPSRLSIQALETLAAIAYRQPITVPEIMELRGLHSAGVVRTLLEKKLIRITGRKKVVGRPLLYGTTKEFLIRFGLKGLDDLPNLEDMAEVFGEEIASQLGDAMKDAGELGEEPKETLPSADDSSPEGMSHDTPADDAPPNDIPEDP
ncbi:MAG TPA: SMC-Scp complex subunit ScpB [Vicinamibacteria bacterium]